MSIELGLDRILGLLHHLPPYTRPTIHVAGTNGKGSVTSMLSSILLASNPPLCIGRFNSPHLVSIYDCIVIDNKAVVPDVYSAARTIVENADREHGSKLSSFELLTATALLIFEQAKVDIAVIEVGLGGRLDATNVIPDHCVLASALTAVGLDHQAFLGDTPSAIAKEKASIARSNKPFILGKQGYPEVEDAVEGIVKSKGGHLIKANEVILREWDPKIDGTPPPAFRLSATNFQAPPSQPVSLNMSCFATPVYTQLPLYGAHQADNLATAMTIISAILTHPACIHLGLRQRITPQSVAEGIRKVRWPGRLSFCTFSCKAHPDDHPMVVLVDGAHNPASSATLSAYITHLLSLLAKPDPSTSRAINITYILALSHSPPKTPFQTLSPLLPPRLPETNSQLHVRFNVAALKFTPPDGMPWVKAEPPAQLLEVINDLSSDTTVWTANGDDSHQLEHALEWAWEKGGIHNKNSESLVVIAGSLYLVADFYRLLGRTSSSVSSSLP